MYRKEIIFISENIFVAFLKQHPPAFVDLVYRCGLEKWTLYFDIFDEMFLPCRMPTFRCQKVVTHGSHHGHMCISFVCIVWTRSKLQFYMFYDSLVVI